jgi:hypothetical protein
MACSENLDGAPGTWKKWDGKDFTQPGLGGAAAPIETLKAIPGAYPSVSYNTYLRSYVMVFSSWGEAFYYSFSTNLIDWTSPKELTLPYSFPKKGDDWHLWYGTLIGASSNFSGEKAKLYFAHIRHNPTERIFYQADVTFTGVIASGYTVTVISEGTGASGSGEYRERDKVTINAGTPPSGKKFKNWTANSPITFADANASETTFTMLSYNMTVTAHFESEDIVSPPSTDSAGGCDSFASRAVMMLLPVGAALVILRLRITN